MIIPAACLWLVLTLLSGIFLSARGEADPTDSPDIAAAAGVLSASVVGLACWIVQ